MREYEKEYSNHKKFAAKQRVCGTALQSILNLTARSYLIKDYVIKLRPGQAEEIKNLPLGRCIADFVDGQRVKQVAARAAWLGNDETHYLRKWEEKDMRDLKNLISLTVHWIVMEELTKGAIEQMP